MKTPTIDSHRLETVPCPLCEDERCAPMLKARDILYGRPGVFEVVRCKNCGHIYLNPRPAEAFIQDFYPADYGPHHTDRASQRASRELSSLGASKPWYLRGFIRGIPGVRSLFHWLTDSYAEVIPDVKACPKLALEIGCADGRFLRRLRDAGWQAKGVELVSAPAQAAQSQGFDVHIGTLESASMAKNTFDAVFAFMVVEHLHYPKATFREIHRILKPNGWFVFSVPNAACWEFRFFRQYWLGLQAPFHLQWFSIDCLRKLLDMTDFSAERIIHQRNATSIAASAGIWLRDCFPGCGLGQELLSFAEAPSVWGQLALLPLAKVLAWAHQAGRLTIIARPKGK